MRLRDIAELFVFAGPPGAIALAIGLLVIVAGMGLPVRRAPRTLGLCLVVLALMPVPIAVIGGEDGAWYERKELVRVGREVPSHGVIQARRRTAALHVAAALATTLGLVGAAAGLARSENRDTRNKAHFRA